jgi:cation diffusion facilitator family transporter
MKEDKAVKATIWSIFGNFFLALVKGLVGYFGHSYAMIADAIESTSDVFSSLIVLIGLKYASKPADDAHPYGHGKAEPIATILVSFFLVLSAFVIADQSIEHIRTPHKTPHPYTLFVLLGIILFKEFFYRITKKKGKETGSSALVADAWHHRSDALTSVAAFIGISIALIGGPGYETADDWAALIATVIILVNAYLILRPAFGELMDEHRFDDLIAEIRVLSKEVDGVIDTEKCFIKKMGLRYYVDLHMIVSGDLSVKEGHAISHHLKDYLIEKLPSISNVLIHVEPSK